MYHVEAAETAVLAQLIILMLHVCAQGADVLDDDRVEGVTDALIAGMAGGAMMAGVQNLAQNKGKQVRAGRHETSL